jgi:hypothetical protein
MGQRTGRQAGRVPAFYYFPLPRKAVEALRVVLRVGREGERERSLACRGGADASGQGGAGLGFRGKRRVVPINSMDKSQRAIE